MRSLFLVGLLVGSSLAVAVLAIRGLRLSIRAAPAAGAALLEFVALWVLCLAGNLALGILGVILVRSLTAVFISVYVVNDLSVVVVAALQAFVLHAWMRPGRR
jgi:hypothetical protein